MCEHPLFKKSVQKMSKIVNAKEKQSDMWKKDTL